MANLLVDAQNNFRNWSNVYDGVRENEERLRARTREFSIGGADDTNGSVNPSGVLIEEDHARMNSSLDAGLLATMRTFGSHLDIAPDQSRDTYLAALKDKNSAANDNVQVKSRGVTFASVVAGTNVGDSVLLMCATDENGDVIEAATIEELTFKALGSSADKPSLGLETFSVQGEGLGSQSEFLAGGVGIRLGGLTANGGGRSGLLENASFDLAFRGTGDDKISGFEIISGAANIAQDRTAANIAQDRDDNHGALAITGDCKFRFNFRNQGVGLTFLQPFIAGIFQKVAAFTGTLTIRFGSSGTAYTVADVHAAATASYTLLTLDPDTLNAWLINNDTDGEPFLEFEVSSYSAGTIYLDDAICEALPSIGGRPVIIVSGLTPTVKNDSHTQRCTLDVGTGLQTFSSGAAGDTVDSILYDGVEVLPSVVTFITDLATTVNLVVDAINSLRTYPNVLGVKEAAAGELTIKQEVPVEGTHTLVISVTDNGGGLSVADLDVTGASLGKLQDSLVRRSGQYLPHAGSASSGWEDHA